MYIIPTIKLTELCNFHCNYCEYRSFAFTQKDNKIIDRDLAIDIATQCIKNNHNLNLNTNICWHGGEPLLYPTKDFVYILEKTKEIAEHYQTIVNHSIQTNGYLINEEWCNIFQQYNIMVGVSIDGPENINGKQREKDTVEQILKNIRDLQKISRFSGVLTVLTDNHKDKELELFNFYKENNIHNVGLCKAFNASMEDTVSNEVLKNFYINFFDLFFNDEYPLEVREFKAYMAKIFNKDYANYCFVSGRKACGHFITFNPNGDVFICDNSYVTANKLFNIKDETLENILSSSEYREATDTARKLITEKCKNCDYYKYCGSGCFRNDLADYTDHYFCETYKCLIDHMLKVCKQ